MKRQIAAAISTLVTKLAVETRDRNVSLMDLLEKKTCAAHTTINARTLLVMRFAVDLDCTWIPNVLKILAVKNNSPSCAEESAAWIATTALKAVTKPKPNAVMLEPLHAQVQLLLGAVTKSPKCAVRPTENASTNGSTLKTDLHNWIKRLQI